MRKITEFTSKKLFLVTGLLCLTLGLILPLGCTTEPKGLSQQSKPIKQNDYKEGEIIVKFREGISIEEVKKINESLNVDIIKVLSPGSTYLLNIPKDVSVEEMIEKYLSIQSVEYAEPNYILRIQ